jgi:hypothetical protein
MDHDVVVRQKMTERYLLHELDPEQRDQFEEHLFDCQDCALDVRAAARFIEQSKVVLAEDQAAASAQVLSTAPAPPQPRWFAWLRPALVVPVLAMLLAVVTYQNLVTYPQLQAALNQPRVLPWASVNLGTRGGSPTPVTASPAEGFNLFVNIPPDSRYQSYRFDLYNPAGKLEWSRTIPAVSAEDTRSIYVPGASREQGTYKLAVHGITSAGEISEVSGSPVTLQIQK